MNLFPHLFSRALPVPAEPQRSPSPHANTGMVLAYFQQYVSALPAKLKDVYVVPYQSATSSWRSLDRIWALARTLGELDSTTASGVQWEQYALMLPGAASLNGALSWASVHEIVTGSLTLQQLYQRQPIIAVQPQPQAQAQTASPNSPLPPPPLTPRQVFDDWKTLSNLACTGNVDHNLYETLEYEFGPTLTARQVFDRLIDLTMFHVLITSNHRSVLPVFEGWKKLHEIDCPQAFIFQFDWAWLIGIDNAKKLRSQLRSVKNEMWAKFQPTRTFPESRELLHLMSVGGKIDRSKVMAKLPHDVRQLPLSYPMRQQPNQFATMTVAELRAILADEPNRERWPFTDDFAATFCSRYGTQATCHQCQSFSYVVMSKPNSTASRRVPMCDSCRCDRQPGINQSSVTSPVSRQRTGRRVQFSSSALSSSSSLQHQLQQQHQNRHPSPVPTPTPPTPDPNQALAVAQALLQLQAQQRPTAVQQQLTPMLDLIKLQVAMLKLLLHRPLDEPTQELLRQQLNEHDRGTLNIVLPNSAPELTTQQITKIVHETVATVRQSLRSKVPHEDDQTWLNMAEKVNQIAEAHWKAERQDRNKDRNERKKQHDMDRNDFKSALGDLHNAVTQLETINLDGVVQRVTNAIARSQFRLDPISVRKIVHDLAEQLRTTHSLADPDQVVRAMMDNLPSPPRNNNNNNNTTNLPTQPAQPTPITQADLNNITAAIESVSRSLLSPADGLKATIQAEVAKLNQVNAQQQSKLVAELQALVSQMQTAPSHTQVRDQIRRASVQATSAEQLSEQFARQQNDIQTLINSPELAQHIAAQLESIAKQREDAFEARIEKLLQSAPTPLNGPAFVQLINEHLLQVLPTQRWVQDQFQHLEQVLPKRAGNVDIDQAPMLQHLVAQLNASPEPVTVPQLRQIMSQHSTQPPALTFDPAQVKQAVNEALEQYIAQQNERYNMSLLHASTIEHSLADLSIQLEQQGGDAKTAELIQTAIKQINQLPTQLLNAILGQIEGVAENTPASEVLRLAQATSVRWREEQERRWLEVLKSNASIAKHIEEQQQAIETLTADFQGQTRVLSTQIQSLLVAQANTAKQQRDELDDIKRRITAMPAAIANVQPPWVQGMLNSIRDQQNQQKQELSTVWTQAIADLEKRLNNNNRLLIGPHQPNPNPNPADPTAAINSVPLSRLQQQVDQLQQQLKEQKDSKDQVQQLLDQTVKTNTGLLGQVSKLQAELKELQHQSDMRMVDIEQAHAQSNTALQQTQQAQIDQLKQERNRLERLTMELQEQKAGQAQQELNAQKARFDQQLKDVDRLHQQQIDVNEKNWAQISAQVAKSHAEQLDLVRQQLQAAETALQLQNSEMRTQEQKQVDRAAFEAKRTEYIAQLEAQKADLEAQKEQLKSQLQQQNQNQLPVSQIHASNLAALEQRIARERDAQLAAYKQSVQEQVERHKRDLQAQLAQQKATLDRQFQERLNQTSLEQKDRERVIAERDVMVQNLTRAEAQTRAAFQQELAEKTAAANAQIAHERAQIQQLQARITEQAALLQNQPQQPKGTVRSTVKEATGRRFAERENLQRNMRTDRTQLARLQQQLTQAETMVQVLSDEMKQNQNQTPLARAPLPRIVPIPGSLADDLMDEAEAEEKQQPTNTTPFVTQDYRNQVLEYLRQAGTPTVDPYALSNVDDLNALLNAIGSDAGRSSFIAVAQSYWQMTMRSPRLLQLLSYAWHPQVQADHPNFGSLLRRLQELQQVSTDDINTIWPGSAMSPTNILSLIDIFRAQKSRATADAAQRLLTLLRQRAAQIQALIPNDLRTITDSTNLDNSTIYTWFTAPGSSTSNHYTISNQLRSVRAHTPTREYLFGPFTSVTDDNRILGQLYNRLKANEKILIAQLGASLLNNADKAFNLLQPVNNTPSPLVGPANTFSVTVSVLHQSAPGQASEQWLMTPTHYQVRPNPDRRETTLEMSNDTYKGFFDSPIDAVKEAMHLAHELYGSSWVGWCLTVQPLTTSDNVPILKLTSFHQTADIGFCVNDLSLGICLQQHGKFRLNYQRLIYRVVKHLVERMDRSAMPEFLQICAPILCRPDVGPCFNDKSSSLLDWHHRNQAPDNIVTDMVGFTGSLDALFVHVDIDKSSEAPDVSHQQFTVEGCIQWQYEDLKRTIAQALSAASPDQHTALYKSLSNTRIGTRTLAYHFRVELDKLKQPPPGLNVDDVLQNVKRSIPNALRTNRHASMLSVAEKAELSSLISAQTTPADLYNLLLHSIIEQEVLTLGDAFKRAAPQNNRALAATMLLDILLRAQTDIPISGLDFLDSVAKFGTGHAMCMFAERASEKEESHQLSASTFAIVSRAIESLFR